jgi:aerobic-type carbon monoxide dehydrogenase small subunit (CoxS/CutS family)
MSEQHEIVVNGAERSCRAGVSTTLLEVLRDQLGLTGTKRGCNQGVCGACSVMVDGRPARACLTLAADCADRQVTTIEGLGTPARPNAVQQALIESGAVQCGFCTPGMVVAATALLNEHPDADVETIRRGLSGNLCRCSGYRKIVEAVRLAASRKAP